MKTPVKYILQGMAIPLLVVIVFAFGGAIVAITNGSDSVIDTVRFGAGVGLFLSLFGGLEIALGLLIEGGSFKRRLWRAFGFLFVWFIAVYYVLNCL